MHLAKEEVIIIEKKTIEGNSRFRTKDSGLARFESQELTSSSSGWSKINNRSKRVAQRAVLRHPEEEENDQAIQKGAFV